MQQNFFTGHSKQGLHRLAYTEFGENNFQKPPVLCLHGLTRNGRDFDVLAEALAASGRKVYCPDMAGRGLSDWFTDPLLYTYEQYLADIVCFLLHIKTPVVDLVGTSMGGLLGLLLASTPITPVRRLIMNDVGPFLSFDTIKELASCVGWTQTFETEKDLESYLRHVHKGFGHLTDEQWHRLASTSGKQNKDGKWMLAYDPGLSDGLKIFSMDMSFWAYYATTTCPVLVLHGEKSTVLSEATACRMVETGPKARVVTLPNIGHAPALMAEDQINLVKEFLNE